MAALAQQYRREEEFAAKDAEAEARRCEQAEAKKAAEVAALAQPRHRSARTKTCGLGC
jgi:hypothetical protein